MSSLPDLSSLLTSPWTTLMMIAFGVFGVVGTVFGIHMWMKRKEKLPYYAIRSDNIIADLASRFERLQMLYGGESIRDFTATRVVFWNGGRDPILHNDVPPSNPIAIKVREGSRILDASNLQDNDADSQFGITVTDDRSTAKCEFHHVERGKGVVIQVLHTGKSGGDIAVVGTVIGPGNPRRKSIFADPSLRKQTKWRCVVLALSILGYVLIWYTQPGAYPISVLAGAILSAALVSDLSSLRTKRVPKGLEAFEGS